MVLIGAGSIGIACARRIATGKHLIIGDINSKTAKKVEEDLYKMCIRDRNICII